MRAKEFEESAVSDLKKQLPSLKRTDYSTIDKLMRRLSKRHGVSGKNLHDMFVSKYGESPDHWIRKYKNKLSELNTDGKNQTNVDLDQVKKFINWTKKQLNIQHPLPKIILSFDTNAAQKGHHTGLHTNKGGNDIIWVYVKNRNLIDIFRTIFHELVHQRQEELNMLGPDKSYPGSPIEAMADMLAGKYIKIYGKKHPEIFQ